jgi:hypothetical protein
MIVLATDAPLDGRQLRRLAVRAAAGLARTGSHYGHGSGATSWAPLMGVGYYSEVTQWDRGEYSAATNGGSGANYGKGPSDLAVVTTYNGFGYRADDHANTTSAATALSNNGGAVSGGGIIGSAQDADLFTFMTGAGAVSLNVAPAGWGANLDIRADLLDAAGNLVATSNPEAGLGAALAANLAAGTYFLRIDGVGAGNPAADPPTGYSDYGSLGQYTISGLIIDAGQFATLAVNDVAVSEGAGQAVFTVTISGTLTEPLTVNYATADDTAQAGADYSATQGTLTFLPGGPNQLPVNVAIASDTAYEGVERFFLTLQNASTGALIADGQGAGTINDDDFALSISDWSTREGSPNRGKRATAPRFTPFTFTISLSGAAPHEISVRYDTVDGTAIAESDYSQAGGVVTFAPGETSKSVTVNVVADTSVELDERFQVVLSAPSGAGLADAAGEGIILDDDSKASGKLSGLSSTKTPQSVLPKPVRDVFAWQEGGLGHEHDHEQGHEEEDHDFAEDHLAIVFAARHTVSISSTGPRLESRHDRAFADWASRRAARRAAEVGISGSAPPSIAAAEIELFDLEREADSPTDTDWLDILASDLTR